METVLGSTIIREVGGFSCGGIKLIEPTMEYADDIWKFRDEVVERNNQWRISIWN